MILFFCTIVRKLRGRTDEDLFDIIHTEISEVLYRMKGNIVGLQNKRKLQVVGINIDPCYEKCKCMYMLLYVLC